MSSGNREHNSSLHEGIMWLLSVRWESAEFGSINGLPGGPSINGDLACCILINESCLMSAGLVAVVGLYAFHIHRGRCPPFLRSVSKTFTSIFTNRRRSITSESLFSGKTWLWSVDTNSGFISHVLLFTHGSSILTFWSVCKQTVMLKIALFFLYFYQSFFLFFSFHRIFLFLNEVARLCFQRGTHLYFSKIKLRPSLFEQRLHLTICKEVRSGTFQSGIRYLQQVNIYIFQPVSKVTGKCKLDPRGSIMVMSEKEGHYLRICQRKF